jgi:sugar phosphate isomerase/epimerase
VVPSGLSTWCRGESETPADFVARARAIGAGAIAIDRRVDARWLEELQLGRGGLAVCAVEAPCPAVRGARAARLASSDRDERRTAQRQTEDAILLAARTGAGVVVVTLGALGARVDWDALARKFAHGAWDPDDDEDAVAEARVTLEPRALDLARQGIDPLLAKADQAGVTIAMASRARWWDVPDDAAVGVLLADFHGAPLAPWLDAGAAAVRETLGWGRMAESLAAWGQRAAGAWLSDASGLVVGLPWGRGEVDTKAVTDGLGERAIGVVHCAPGATDEELAAALHG